MTENAPINREKSTVSWGPLSAVLVTGGVYVLAQVFVGLVLGIAPVLIGWSEARIDTWLESTPGQFTANVLIQLSVLFLLWQFLQGRRARFRDLGMVHPKWLDLWDAVKGYVLYFVLILAILQLSAHLVPGIDLEQEQELGFSKSATGLALVPIFVSLVILPPLVEELLFRGFLYTGLRRKLPVIAAGFITCVLFGLAHLQVGSGNALLWVAALDTFVLSVILVRLREKTKSLWASMGVHMLKNLAAFIVLFVVKL